MKPVGKKTTCDLRRISEMRNLGPACEADLNAVGIHTAEELKRIGPEAAFIKLMEGSSRSGKGARCVNAAYLYALYGAIHDIDWRNIPAAKKDQFRQLAAEMRNSGRFT